MLRVYADLGNSRLKWGRTLPDGSLGVIALPADDPSAWLAAWSEWNPERSGSEWAISTVNPPVAKRFDTFLDAQLGVTARWFRSAADVPIRHTLQAIQTAGTDRAFAVLGALVEAPTGGAGLVISCGSAITVERISASGVWEGGAIAPGLRLSAEALHAMSTQLPLVHPVRPPEGWGRSTIPAIEAGVFWGAVGTIRSLVARQSEGMPNPPWVVWSGGDANLLIGSAALGLEPSRLAPSLVLEGIRAACGG